MYRPDLAAERFEALPPEAASILAEQSRNLVRVLIATTHLTGQNHGTEPQPVMDPQAQDFWERFAKACGDEDPDGLLIYLLDTTVLKMQLHRLWRFDADWRPWEGKEDGICILFFPDMDNHHHAVRRFGFERQAPYAVVELPHSHTAGQ